MIPATMNEARKSKTAPAMLATVSTAVLASAASFGCRLLTSAGRSSWARVHAAWTFLPMTGHSATPAGGAGITSVFSCTLSTRSCTESPSAPISTAVGKTMTTTPTSVSSVAASPCLPPILRANF